MTFTNMFPISPTLVGDTVVSVDTQHGVLIDTAAGWSIRVEGACVLRRVSGEVLVEGDDFSALTEALAAWVGTELGAVAYSTDGGLIVSCGSERMEVPPNPAYEAWGIAGPRQEKTISLPGGAVSVWSGT